MPEKRVLVTVVLTDAVGFSTRARENETAALQDLQSDFETMRRQADLHGGRVLKSTGDGLLMVFDSPGLAVECALEIQRTFASRGAEDLHHRIGVHLADVLVDESDARGDGVNIAARLQEMATPGAVCVSKSTYDVIQSRLGTAVRDLGKQRLKNIPDPVGVIEIAPTHEFKLSKRKRTLNLGWVFGGVALVGVGVLAVVQSQDNSRLRQMILNQKPTERVVIEKQPVYLPAPNKPVAAAPTQSTKPIQAAKSGSIPAPVPVDSSAPVKNLDTNQAAPDPSVAANLDPQPPADPTSVPPTPRIARRSTFADQMANLAQSSPDVAAQLHTLRSAAHQSGDFSEVLAYTTKSIPDKAMRGTLERHFGEVQRFLNDSLAALKAATKDAPLTESGSRISVWAEGNTVHLVGVNGKERRFDVNKISPSAWFTIARAVKQGPNPPVLYDASRAAFAKEFADEIKKAGARQKAMHSMDGQIIGNGPQPEGPPQQPQ